MEENKVKKTQKERLGKERRDKNPKSLKNQRRENINFIFVITQ